MNDEPLPDLSEALTMTQAARLMHGRGGRPPSVDTVRRWTSPRRGCRPLGPGGPLLILRSIRLNGELLTLREWVEAFESERLRLAYRHGRRKS